MTQLDQQMRLLARLYRRAMRQQYLKLSPKECLLMWQSVEQLQNKIDELQRGGWFRRLLRRLHG